MLNVGPLELLVVLAVALVVVGPERLPELARSVGRALRQFRQVQDEVRDMVSLGVDDEVREAAAEFRKATGDLRRGTDVRGAVKKAEQSLRDEVAEPPMTATSSADPPIPPEPEEAGGPPADRLVDDGAAEPSPATDPPAPPRSEEPPSASDPSSRP
jgi:sec-independent protein translocase protein TatB